MTSVRRHTHSLVVRLLLVVTVAVGHCCLLGQTAHAAGVHAGTGPVHGAEASPAGFECQRTPVAPMACDGAHAVATARAELPAPALASMPAAVTMGLGSLTPQPARAYRDPPDARPPSRATLQIFLI